MGNTGSGSLNAMTRRHRGHSGRISIASARHVRQNWCLTGPIVKAASAGKIGPPAIPSAASAADAATPPTATTIPPEQLRSTQIRHSSKQMGHMKVFLASTRLACPAMKSGRPSRQRVLRRASTNATADSSRGKCRIRSHISGVAPDHG